MREQLKMNGNGEG